MGPQQTSWRLLSAVAVLASVTAIVPIPLVADWDSVYQYSFDYERVLNATNKLTRRVGFRAAVHFRMDLDNPNSMLAFFEQPVYEHDDQYHRNRYFREKIDGLALPFRINYYRSGLVRNIATDINDSDLSSRFKKTVASLAQFDWDYINQMTHRRYFDFNFTTPEVNIFGECHVINHSAVVGEGRILTKDILLETCIKDKAYSRSSLSVEFKFRLSRERNFHFVNLNGIEYVPGSDSYSMLSQRLEFVENVKAQTPVDSGRLIVSNVKEDCKTKVLICFFFVSG